MPNKDNDEISADEAIDNFLAAFEQLKSKDLVDSAAVRLLREIRERKEEKSGRKPAPRQAR